MASEEEQQEKLTHQSQLVHFEWNNRCSEANALENSLHHLDQLSFL